MRLARSLARTARALCSSDHGPVKNSPKKATTTGQFLVRSETDRAAARPLEAAARKLLGTGDRKPGSQDVFGQTFTCDELVAQVGLDEDTNRNLTRRMLLLLESTPLVGKHAHAEHRWRVLRTYLQRGAKPFRPPRFLLNDVIRY